jgi:thiol-disulfide isomerase/thioredoxin
MNAIRCLGCLALAVITAGAALALAREAPSVPPEFTHRRAVDWLNSEPLTLAGLRGKVVLVEFWAFECGNCVNSLPWVDKVVRSREAAGLVVVGVHTPEWASERSVEHVRSAVERFEIRHPVMVDSDYSYWNALHTHFWPTFYLIGRDGLLYGRVVGEMHTGAQPAIALEAAIDQLLAVSPRG